MCVRVCVCVCTHGTDCTDCACTAGPPTVHAVRRDSSPFSLAFSSRAVVLASALRALIVSSSSVSICVYTHAHIYVHTHVQPTIAHRQQVLLMQYRVCQSVCTHIHTHTHTHRQVQSIISHTYCIDAFLCVCVYVCVCATDHPHHPYY